MDYSNSPIASAHPISLGHYLFQRLRQLQVQTIFGLPGDFNMALLDKIYEIPGLRWAGNTNELNAAYAADGYARIKGLGCLVTTFGVGELSAINGIAGSFAEHVAVLHVVGMPASHAQVKKLLLHHTLGNGDYAVFHRMAANMAAYTTVLSDSETATKEIDKCLKIAWKRQRPVYLGIPMNLANMIVDGSMLRIPLDLSLKRNDPEVEKDVVNSIVQEMKRAKNPVVIADACVTRHDVIQETRRLVDLTQFPVFVTPMGKGAIDEQHPRFGGVYVGSMSSPEVREVVDFADFILVVGTVLSDFNTSSFNFSYKAKNVVLLYANHAKLKNAMYPDMKLKFVLQSLLQSLSNITLPYKPQPVPEMIKPRVTLQDNVPLRQEWVWNQISHWFHEGDIVITETGTSAFGINQTRFPNNTRAISQVLWGSIGYSLGACLGASFAVEELGTKNRVVLFVGDGALQLTVQEISTMIRWGLKPYLFVMNNKGYTIDRLLHKSSTAGYHDIQPWDNLKLLPAFGAVNYDARKVTTVGDFLKLVHDPQFAIDDKLKMIEVVLPSMDAPPALLNKWLLDEELEEELNKKLREYTDDDTSKNTAVPSFKRAKLDNDNSLPLNLQ